MNISKLPEDILYHISGYYGEKISPLLSRDIREQQFLRAIKEKEYYNDTNKTWHLNNLYNILSKYVFLIDNKRITSFIKNKKYTWNNIDKMIRILWLSYSSNARKLMIDTYFPYAYQYEPIFITSREFFKSKTGYYIVNTY